MKPAVHKKFSTAGYGLQFALRTSSALMRTGALALVVTLGGALVVPNVGAPMAHAQSAPAPAAAGAVSAADNIRVLLIPAQETTLVSQMVGRIDRLAVQMGSGVRAGQTIVQMDCGENQAKLRMGQAEFDSAKEQYDAKVRLKSLQAAGEVEVQLAAAAMEKARAQIGVAQSQMRLCQISAPFGGRVVKLHVKQFQGVNVGQPLVDIVSGGPLKLRLNAPSRWLSWMKVGTPFEVLIDETGKAYPATVSALNGRVDAVSQSIEIEATIRGTFPELLAGMSGAAKFNAPGASPANAGAR